MSRALREQLEQSLAEIVMTEQAAQPDDALVERVARAMAVALREDATSPVDGKCYAYTLNAPCKHEGGWATEVDGEFDLMELARAAIAAHAKPHRDMADKLAEALRALRHNINPSTVMRADAALAEYEASK